MTTPTTFLRSSPFRGRVPIHGDPSLIAGHSPWSTGLYYFVLLAAMGVDLVTFHQVLLPALDESAEMLWIAVAGFTVICVATSHAAGQQAKKAVGTRHSPGAATTTWLYLFVWAALGATAFVFRWDATSLDIGSSFVVDGVEQTGMSDAARAEQHRAALLFLAFYLGTGVVSGGAGFIRHQPEVSRYNRALSLRAKAAAEHSRIESKLQAATKLGEAVDKARREHADAWRNLETRCGGSAGRVKREIELKLLDKNTNLPRTPQQRPRDLRPQEPPTVRMQLPTWRPESPIDEDER